MYRYLRNTHLFLGLFCCFYLLMYGISSVQMAHSSWFSTRPAVTETQAALAPGITDARRVARELMDHYGLRGEVGPVRATAAQLSFNIVRPGTVYQIDYTTATGAARIRDNHAGFMGIMNRIHHAKGLWHDYWVLNMWGGFVAVVSAALFLIGATGIYLWFKLRQERVVGAILLVVSLGYSLTIMVLARNAW